VIAKNQSPESPVNTLTNVLRYNKNITTPLAEKGLPSFFTMLLLLWYDESESENIIWRRP